MRIFTIIEADGTRWGDWAAPDAQAALQMLTESATSTPDHFPGFSPEARFIVAEGPAVESPRPTPR